MRVPSGLLVALALCACTSVTGTPAETCDGTWRGIDSVIVAPDVGFSSGLTMSRTDTASADSATWTASSR